jgi:uncharacterized protein (TIGR02679 family)
MTGSAHDRASRIRAALGQPGLAWLIERARAQLSRGEPVAGRIVLRSPTAEQRAALKRLLGRDGRGDSLAVDFGELERTFRDAGLCERIDDAIQELVGPVIDRRAERDRLREAWAAAFAAVEPRVTGHAVLERWLADVRDTGALARIAKNDPASGRLLLERALGTLLRLPADGVPLAELAAEVTGDAHALDTGSALATIVLRGAALLGGASAWDDARERREVWASVGVVCDDLSPHVLTLGLWADGDALTARALRLHAESGVPYRLSLRQLQRDTTAFRPRAAASGELVVFVCENPSVVAAAATRRGDVCAPLVCTEGQPSTAVRVLLDQLRAAGAALRYHGDFDWAGIRIANLVMARHGAQPWRFGVEDYRAAPGGTALSGASVEASWDSSLAAAMLDRGEAVHEEAVLPALLADL